LEEPSFHAAFISEMRKGSEGFEEALLRQRVSIVWLLNRSQNESVYS
jgi:hypothetical protein